MNNYQRFAHQKTWPQRFQAEVHVDEHVCPTYQAKPTQGPGPIVNCEWKLFLRCGTMCDIRHHDDLLAGTVPLGGQEPQDGFDPADARIKPAMNQYVHCG